MTTLSKTQITILTTTLTGSPHGQLATVPKVIARFAKAMVHAFGVEKGAEQSARILACATLDEANAILQTLKNPGPPPTVRTQPKPRPPKVEGARPVTRAGTLQEKVIGLMRRPDGASLDEIIVATGWQKHTVRGFVSGALRNKLGMEPTSALIEGRGRVYSLPAQEVQP